MTERDPYSPEALRAEYARACAERDAIEAKVKPIRARLAAAIVCLAASPLAWAQQEARHVVVPGDTLMGIAQRYLGDATLWREVQRLNPTVRDDRQLRPGSTIVVPLPPPGPVAWFTSPRINGSTSASSTPSRAPPSPPRSSVRAVASAAQTAAIITMVTIIYRTPAS